MRLTKSIMNDTPVCRLSPLAVKTYRHRCPKRCLSGDLTNVVHKKTRSISVMRITSLLSLLIVLFMISLPAASNAQLAASSQMLRLSEGCVRIAEPGQITDTLSVWGDISAPGRYVVPRGTKVHELISYARGPIASRTAGQNLDWSNVRIQISVSRYNPSTGTESVQKFTHRYNQPYPAAFRDSHLVCHALLSVELLW